MTCAARVKKVGLSPLLTRFKTLLLFSLGKATARNVNIGFGMVE